MQLILVIVFIAQLHQYAASVNIVHKAGSNFPPKFKVPAGVYELRRISDDEIGSIKSDHIVTVEQDQPFVKTSGGFKNAYQHLRRQQETSENYGHSLSGVVPSVSGTSNGQEYTQTQRGYQSEVVADGRHNYMQPQREYQSHVGNQNSAPNFASIPDGGVSNQAHRGHHAVRMSQAIPQSDNSHSGLGSASSRQQYLQTLPQGTQHDLQNYHVANENAEGTASTGVSLPAGYEEAGNAQNYVHQSHQIPEGYQVVNESPAAHVVNLPPNYANGNDDYSGSGAGPVQAQQQNEAYAPYEGSYIPQNHQPGVQYDVRKPQHASMQIPLSFVGGIQGLQHQGQLWNMVRNSRKVSHSSPQRFYENQEKKCEHMSRSN